MDGKQLSKRKGKRNGRWRVRIKLLLLLVVMLHGCADSFILFPSTQEENANGAQREMIAFGSGNLELYKAKSPGATDAEPEAFMLCFVGNAARAEWTASWDAQLWGNRSVESWTMNYPGYGASSGPATLRLFPEAGLAAYDHVRRIAGGRPVFVKGESLGTTVALHVAAHRDVAGVILRAPVPLRRLIMGRFGWYALWIGAAPVAMGVPEALDAPNSAPLVKAPAILMLIQTDEIVPVQYQRIVAEAYGGPKRLIENCASDHNGPLHAKAQEELEAAIEWLWQQRRP